MVENLVLTLKIDTKGYTDTTVADAATLQGLFPWQRSVNIGIFQGSCRV